MTTPAIIEGRAHVYGDNVDTDVIIPARYLTTTDPAELAAHCLEDLDPDFVKNCAVGDVIVAGRNFGSGSSREHAPIAIKASGIACIVADSFARIFYRNAINVGLPIVECPGISGSVEAGDTIRVDVAGGSVENVARGRSHAATPLPSFMKDILDAGGLMPWVKRSLDNGGEVTVGVSPDEPVQADWRMD